MSKATGPSFTFNDSGAPLNPGAYRLDVTAFTSNGSRGGSATCAFKVFSTGVATLEWDPSADPSVVGYKLYTGTASGVYSTPVDEGLVTT